MKILAIYPGLNPVFDEVAHALPPLVERGCEVQVVTTRESALKSTEQAANYACFRGVHIHRVCPDRHTLHANPATLRSFAHDLVNSFQPDLLFLNSLYALPLGRSLAQSHGLPSVLRLESLDPLQYLRRRFYGGIPLIGKLAGRVALPHLASRVSALMTNDPADLSKLGSTYAAAPALYYAAHCAQQPEGLVTAPTRDRGQMIYIGSMTRHKNCAVWLDTLPALFEETPVERFTVIGTGPDLHVVETLKKRYGPRIEHIAGVTRIEALQRLSAAWFAYSESITGWGLHCDAWSTRTPMLCPHSTFGVVPGWTGMTPRTRHALVRSVNRLYDDPAYYAGLQDGGALRYQSEHTAEVVGRQYLQIFREVAASAPQAPMRRTAHGPQTGRAALSRSA